MGRRATLGKLRITDHGETSSEAIAGPKEEALLVLDAWTKAFANSEVDGIAQLYAPDALFLGTASKSVVVKSECNRFAFNSAIARCPLRAALVRELFHRDCRQHSDQLGRAIGQRRVKAA
jgi:hypothetical protein